MLTILGQKVNTPIKSLERFPAPQGVQRVVFRTDELTAVCPVTGQPDYYGLNLCYNPGDWCLESKSLKLYLWTFRERGVFAEALAVEIAQDVVDAIEPRPVSVTLLQTPRGGISLEVTCNLP